MTIYKTGYVSEEYPWTDEAARAYQKRIRVKNFSPLGKRVFSQLVYLAVRGISVIFSYNPNLDTIELLEDGLDEETPIGLTNPYARMRYVTYDGHVLDASKNEFDDTLRCLTFTNPPINDHARALAYRAQMLEMKIDSNLDGLLFPEHYVSGTSPKTRIVQKEERHLGEWKNFTANDDARAGTPIKPDIGTLDQWDISQFLNMSKLTAFDFLQETNMPPQDLSALDTLGVATESLIAHRESFISRVFILKQELQAVFATLPLNPVDVTKVTFEDKESTAVVDDTGTTMGQATTSSTTGSTITQETVPTTSLVFESLFPYTPQDIASVGDAYGKGLNQNIVDTYNLS